MDIQSNFQGYIFYTINYKNKMYLGELSTNTANGDFMAYHISRTNLPFFNTTNQLKEAWESVLTQDIKDHGFKASSKDFSQCVSYDAATVIKNIQLSLQNAAKGTVFENEDVLACLYEALARMDSIRPIENLLINLLYKENDGNIWNTHANYGSFKNVQGWNLDVPTIQRLQKEALASKVGLVLSVDFEQAKPFLTEKQITKFIQQKVLRTTAPIRITSGNVTQFTKLIGRKISINSLIRLAKSLSSFWDKLPNTIREDPAIQQQYYDLFEEMSSRIDKLNATWEEKKRLNRSKPKASRQKLSKHEVRDTKSYKTWLENIDAFTTRVQKRYIALMPTQRLPAFVELINKWLQQTRLQDLLTNGQIYNIKNAQDFYKTKMTQWIQDNIFSKCDRNNEYTATQIEKYKSRIGKKMGQAWLPPHDTNFYSDTLIHMTELLLPPDNSFFLYAWRSGNYKVSLYGEQVSIWLGTENPFGQWHDLINVFNNQPQSIKDLDKITVY